MQMSEPLCTVAKQPLYPVSEAPRQCKTLPVAVALLDCVIDYYPLGRGARSLGGTSLPLVSFNFNRLRLLLPVSLRLIRSISSSQLFCSSCDGLFRRG